MIVAGGTGGHIFPAIRLADELKTRNIGEVLFVASSKSQDREILEGKAIRFQTLAISSLKSSGILDILEFSMQLFIGTIESIFILLRFRPDVLVGFGGYVSGPIVLLASLSGIKTIIHEQNVYPGKANRLLVRFAHKIAISFEETRDYLKGFESKIIFTGNPLRQSLKKSKELKPAGNGFRVLVIGGSQGAHRLNILVPEAAGLISKDKKHMLEFIHISGPLEKDDVIKSYNDIGIKNSVFSFTEDMGELYNNCDFVIARAGAMTVSELLSLAIPAILIPYPYAGGHQKLNARVLEKIGSAILLEEKALTPQTLQAAISSLMDRNILDIMSAKAANIQKPDACSILIRTVTYVHSLRSFHKSRAH